MGMLYTKSTADVGSDTAQTRSSPDLPGELRLPPAPTQQEAELGRGSVSLHELFLESGNQSGM